MSIRIFYFILLLKFNAQYSQEIQCGVQIVKPKIYGNINSRIINGEKAVSSSWPWIVSLRNTNENLSHFCGGTLIELDLVITAAHCIEDMSVNDFAIAVGTYESAKPELSNIFLAIEYKIHSSFNGLRLDNGYDIALIRLNRPIKVNTNASLICLPESADVDVVQKKELVAAGW